MNSVFREMFEQRALLWTLSMQQIRKRYLGSVFGLTWLLLTPIMLLVMYTVVFGIIFKPSWPILEEKNVAYPLFLFAGLVVFWVYSDAVTRSPGVIVEQRGLVKRVRFPVQLLPATIGVTSLIVFGFNFALLLAAFLYFHQAFSPYIFLAPLALAPAWIFSMGLAWLLSALGAYFKDIGQASNVITLAGLFLSGVFFPLDAAPEKMRIGMILNPLAGSIESFRYVVLYGGLPDLEIYGVSLLIAIVVFFFGFFVFHKVRAGFADVI